MVQKIEESKSLKVKDGGRVAQRADIAERSRRKFYVFFEYNLPVSAKSCIFAVCFN